MTNDEFEEFNDVEFDDELDSEQNGDSDVTDDENATDASEFVIVDNQITDYLDVESTETVPALFALPQTGVARVDDAIARLGDLENLPVNDHVEIFEDVQRRLHETLADLASS